MGNNSKIRQHAAFWQLKDVAGVGVGVMEKGGQCQNRCQCHETDTPSSLSLPAAGSDLFNVTQGDKGLCFRMSLPSMDHAFDVERVNGQDTAHEGPWKGAAMPSRE